jgi:predicted GTPase
MLVLDEQLLGRNLDATLARWYRGPVLFITDLRPGTVIKDDAIPVLLRQQHQATFLTINETDFWQKVLIDAHFCVVCFALPDSQAREIPQLLRAVFHLPAFQTKVRRMGKVVRVTHNTVSYYTHREREIRTAPI